MKKKILGKISMFLILGFVIALAGCGSSDSASGGSGTGTGKAGERYTADFNGHTYQLIDEDTTWEEARQACISRDGHLATVTSSEEQEYLKGLFYDVYGTSQGPWIGAYSNGAYGGEKNDWCWVTGEKWGYTHWAEGEPSNAEGTEWFVHFYADTNWNDIDNGDTNNNHRGYICEYDDQSDVFEGSDPPENTDIAESEEVEKQQEEQPLEGSDPPETEDYESEDDWIQALQETVDEEDPFYKDLGDGRTAIQSHWRGVQIKYPSSYLAGEDDDALYVYDGDSMYVYARNITAAAESHKNDLAAFCASKAEDQVVRDFTKLFGAPTNTDGIKREGGDGKSRMCVISGNMWNDNADIQFKSKVFISGKQNNFLVIYTAFWRWKDQGSADHFKKINVTSWGKGDMYGQ